MSVAIKVELDIVSVRELNKMFDGVKDSVRNRVMKSSIGKVARRAAKVAKQKAPKGPSGALKRSIGTRYKSYRRGEVWIYAIGPRTKMYGAAPHQPRRKYPIFKPTAYGHLAERGRGSLVAKNAPRMLFYPTPKSITRVASIRVGPARGFRFMARTAAMLNSPSAQLSRFLIEDIRTGIEREAAKYASRGKSIFS